MTASRNEDLPDELATMPPSRRGVARKTELLDAALRIIGSKGLGGLSMRALATEAGVPLSAVGYYFNGKHQLIGEAFQRHTQLETERVLAHVARLREGLTGPEVADVLAQFVIDGLGPARVRLVAEYEFLVESSRRSDLARTSAAWNLSLESQLRHVLGSLGSSSPKADSRLILATLSGLEVNNLGEPITPAQARTIKTVLRRLIAALNS